MDDTANLKGDAHAAATSEVVLANDSNTKLEVLRNANTDSPANNTFTLSNVPNGVVSNGTSGSEHDSATSESDSGVEVLVFTPDDPTDPKNWAKGRKVGVVLILCFLSFCSVFGSSSYAPGELQIRLMYNVNASTASTGLTLYVLGFAFGPLVWGPMSEMYGRTLPYMISWPLLIAAIAPSAWVENITVILIFRFLSGCTAACALNNGFGIISDLYGHDPEMLNKAVGMFAFCPLTGPIFGSLVGFFVAAHSSGKDLWVIRVHLFFTIALYPLVFLLNANETHGPTILHRRAVALRKSTDGKRRVYAIAELDRMRNGHSQWKVWMGHVGRPAGMLVSEPINQGAAVWISLAYGIVYFFFELYPVVFVQQNHIPFQLGGLPFLGIVVGMAVGLVTFPRVGAWAARNRIAFVEKRRTPSKEGGEGEVGMEENSPEVSVKVALLACPLMPISLFWFAWTSSGNVHWIVPTLAGVPFGYSMLTVFYSFSGYVTSTYKIYASSAQATNTFVRSLIASIFPIIAHPIADRLGTDWGVSLFAFLSLGLLPIPIIFVRYGAQLRARSKYAKEAEAVIRAMREKEGNGDSVGLAGVSLVREKMKAGSVSSGGSDV